MNTSQVTTENQAKNIYKGVSKNNRHERTVSSNTEQGNRLEIWDI